MFEKMLKWLKELFGRLFKENLSSDILISDSMSSAINLWSRIYEDGGTWCHNGVHSLHLAQAISSEFARLVTIEMEVSLSGSSRSDYISAQLEPFLDNIRNYAELGCALGGIVFKPYISENKILIDVVHGDCFFPTAFDSSGKMTGAIFISQITRKGNIFTRAEFHNYNNGIHKIENRAFCSSSSYSLGKEISLQSVPEWSQIQPSVIINNVNRPLFAYFKMPMSNCIDRHSPLGVSVYSSSVETIKDADEQFGRLMWEFEGGQLAVDIDEDLFKHDQDGNVSIPKLQERLFRRHSKSYDNSNQNFYEIFSPTLRDQSYKNGFNTILQRIEFQCGLAYGTLSDPNDVSKTAEEIKSSKQRSFSTVRDIQKSLQTALDDLIYSIDILTTLYNLSPSGTYQVAYDWDDSIINNPSQRKQQFWQYVMTGKFPFWRYLVEFENYTEEEAKQIESESQQSLANPFDMNNRGS